MPQVNISIVRTNQTLAHTLELAKPLIMSRIYNTSWYQYFLSQP
ncbi:hypothetical protein DO65_5122 [Burkholderia pseudomallei]|nr:hypothetical protein DO65_5122 [Burkholderia pseudomallei]